MKKTIQIEVCYALPEQQELVTMTLAEGTTAIQAVTDSNLEKLFPEISLSELKLAIYSSVIDNNSILKQGDRIEILRPLLADPKEVRKRRAAEMKIKRAAQKLDKATKKSA